MYTKGQVLTVMVEHDNVLDLTKGQNFVVLETPETLRILRTYMVQPLGAEAKRRGFNMTPAMTIPAASFEKQVYDVAGQVDLHWSYFKNLGRSLTELLEENPQLYKF